MRAAGAHNRGDVRPRGTGRPLRIGSPASQRAASRWGVSARMVAATTGAGKRTPDHP